MTMKHINIFIVAVAAMMLTACGTNEDFIFEYTPEANGDNSWTAIPEPSPVIPDDDVVPGKVPSDPMFEGTLVSRLSAVYAGDLTVKINEASTAPSTQSVIIRAVDGNHINFGLKNFMLIDGDNVMPIGTILLKNIEVKESKESASDIEFDFQDAIVILPGDSVINYEGEEVEMGAEDWLGPILGNIPLKLEGKGNKEKMNIGIDITMEALGQIIHVDFVTSDIPGISPADPTLAGTLVSKFSDSYTGSLTVKINDTSTEPSQQNVIIKAVDEDHINFALKNFLLIDGDNVMPVGTILLQNLKLVENADGNMTFSFDEPIDILAGDKQIMYEGEMVEMGEEDWLGPFLGPIPVKLTGISNGKTMTIGIDIVMEGLGQTIHVDFIVK